MGKKRKEHDSLGVVEIPSEAAYGAQTFRALQNFQISKRVAHPSLILAFLRIKSAAAEANRKSGNLNAELAGFIIRAGIEVTKKNEELWRSFFPLDPYQAGAGTSQNMNVNEVLANFANRIVGNPFGTYAPVHPNDHVNRSQSTNDVYPTAMRLALLEVSRSLSQELGSLSKSLEVKAKKWRSIPKSGRTHLQDAVPMYLGQEFQAYADTVGKCAEWIETGRDGLCEIGIGGSAVGTGLNVPKTYPQHILKELKKLTGENLRFNKNKFEAMQSQSPVTFYSSMLRLVAIELTRICNDLRLLASGPSTGLAEVFLPEVQPGSSIMPGKVNPSIVEMANQTWYSVIGYDQTVMMCAQAGQLELNVMMPMMAYSSIEATTIATQAVKTLRTRCIEGLGANVPRLRKYFESTPQIATALSPKLGYEQVSKLVQEALKKDMSVVDLVRQKELLTDQELKALLNLKRLTGS